MLLLLSLISSGNSKNRCEKQCTAIFSCQPRGKNVKCLSACLLTYHQKQQYNFIFIFCGYFFFSAKNKIMIGRSGWISIFLPVLFNSLDRIFSSKDMFFHKNLGIQSKCVSFRLHCYHRYYWAVFNFRFFHVFVSQDQLS